MARLVPTWLLVFTLACGGDAPAGKAGDPTDPSEPDVGDDTDDAPVGDDDDAPVGDDDDAPAAPSWTGNWKVDLDFSYTCDVGFGNLKSNSGSGKWNLELSGSPSDLEAWVNDNNWYTMTGSGDADGVFLCGAFPIPDLNNDAAPSGNDNQLCIDAAEVVGAEEVHGELTGWFMDGFGADCEMDPSPLVLTK